MLFFKKVLVFLPVVMVFGFIAFCSTTVPYDGPPADLVIMNAKIITIDRDNPRASALAVIDDKIVGVGSDSYIGQFVRDGSTQVIDGDGRMVVPGFNDAHAHFGRINQDYIDLRYTTDPKTITEKVAEKVAQSQPGELIRGGRWEHEMFIDRQWPTKELLDSVSPDNPVSLSRADGHSVLVNSYVIKQSGITNETPDPYGGEIQRDPVTGEATGIFKETARSLLNTRGVRVERSPEEERARREKGWKDAFELAASLGVTTVQLPRVNNVFQQYLDQGKLSLRVYFSGSLGENTDGYQRYVELQNQYPRTGDWLRFGFLKGYIDGTLGSGTMLVFEPFEDEPDKTGLPRMEYEELERRVIAADKLGLQIGIHAIGTKANHWILNAFEAAQKTNGIRDSRHRSEHAQILHPDDISRFGELGVIPSMQPTHAITDKRFAEKRIGTERARAGAYVWRSLLNAGARIAFGTDYGVEPLDPLEGLFAGVTRKDRFDESDTYWFPEQLLTLEETIELYTLGSAYAEFMEDRKGMLKTGYLADIVMFNRDLETIPEREIMKSHVVYTIVGGKIVFQSEGAK
ncbi:amidohydrolase [candidate division KSB1 bacterium]|nr:amidohydrolase [candidate division KSB1 bacterium]